MEMCVLWWQPISFLVYISWMQVLTGKLNGNFSEKIFMQILKMKYIMK